MNTEVLDKIRDWYFLHDPEAVCYIEKYDNEGFMVEEIDGDYCDGCAMKKAEQLDKECGGGVYHEVHEESSPENDHLAYCSECGCLLNASLITGEFAEDDINELVEDLHNVKQFDDVQGELAWKIWQFFTDEDEFRKLFPKQMKYISRRLTNLYKKSENDKD